MGRGKSFTRWSSRGMGGGLFSGFTLVELLVVIAIITLLVQLLLPAIQAARERARKTQCQNHLKQLGVAAQLHVDAYKYFPTGGWSDAFVADPGRGYGRDQPGSWLFSLLDYMEESPLRAAGGERVDDSPLGPGLTALYQSAPTIFYCPSRRRAQAYPFKRAGNGHWTLHAGQGILQLAAVTKCDYAVNSGDAIYSAADPFDDEQEMWTPKSYGSLKTDPQQWTDTTNSQNSYFQNGVSYYRSEVKPARILDGLSKTYFCGEKFLAPEFYDDVNVL
jgi:prepilin-type N-terminal cleavage/methylation domain-containing protein